MDEAWHSAVARHAFMAESTQRSEDPDWEMMGFCPQGKVLTVAIVVVVVVVVVGGGGGRRLEQFGTPVAKVKRVARALSW